MGLQPMMRTAGLFGTSFSWSCPLLFLCQFQLASSMLPDSIKRSLSSSKWCQTVWILYQFFSSLASQSYSRTRNYWMKTAVLKQRFALSPMSEVLLSSIGATSFLKLAFARLRYHCSNHCLISSAWIFCFYQRSLKFLFILSPTLAKWQLILWLTAFFSSSQHSWTKFLQLVEIVINDSLILDQRASLALVSLGHLLLWVLEESFYLDGQLHLGKL